MAEEITYYAIVDEFSSRERAGRSCSGESSTTADSETKRSRVTLSGSAPASLHSAERGDTMNDFYPITEDEAMRIVDRIRRESGTSS